VVGHADLYASPGNADGAHDQAHPMLLPDYEMLDRRADG
jgi:hypothetical protein